MMNEVVGLYINSVFIFLGGVGGILHFLLRNSAEHFMNLN